LAGDGGQRFQGDRFLGVRHPAAKSVRLIDFALEHQPRGRSRFPMASVPEAAAYILIDHRPFGSFAELDRLPRLGGQRRGDLFRQPHRISPGPLRRPAGARLPRQHLRGRIHSPERLGDVGLDDVPQAASLERIQQLPAATVHLVRDDPVGFHQLVLQQPLDQFHGDLRLGAKPHLGRNAGLAAPRPIADPFGGQIQLLVQQAVAPGRDPHKKHAYLAVGHHPLPAAILLLHSHAVRALLEERRFVDHPDDAQRPSLRRGNQRLGKDCLNLPLHVRRFPRRRGQEMLPRQHGGGLHGPVPCRLLQHHPLHVLPPRRREQSLDVLGGMLPRLHPAKTRSKATLKLLQSVGASAQDIPVHPRPSLSTS
jgi:hypothetical protein